MPKFMAHHTILVTEKSAKRDDRGNITEPAVIKEYNEGDIVECNDEQFAFYKSTKSAKTQSQIDVWLEKQKQAAAGGQLPREEAVNLDTGKAGPIGATTDVSGDTGSQGSAQTGGTSQPDPRTQPAANQEQTATGSTGGTTTATSTGSTGATGGTQTAAKDTTKSSTSPF